MSRAHVPEKPCATCGRRIIWRKKWERDWEHVRYCSDKCRAGKAAAKGGGLEAAILSLLSTRARGATACPSEVARAEGGERWRELMEPVREATRRLVAAGRVDILQGGRVVDPSSAKGPIRLRLRKGP
ncbi:MAG: DUF2256 and DUF3253 domain-containing protein [Deltaproteobacteria bacterium]|nr:DUF2256 and DUF3253 domain-containing protein [Deltaproteobacteria bacterium]